MNTENKPDPDKLNELAHEVCGQSAVVIMLALIIIRRGKKAKRDDWFNVSYRELKNVSGFKHNQTIRQALYRLSGGNNKGNIIGSYWIERRKMFDKQESKLHVQVRITNKLFW